MSYEHIVAKLEAGGVVIIDGATGTGIESRGGPLVSGAWSSMANVDSPEIVRSVHDDYVRAGSELITTNTFAGSRLRLRSTGLQHRMQELNEAAVSIARQAAAAADHPVAIAGSISAISTDGNAGDIAEPPEAYREFREQADVLAAAGVDCIALEMLKDVAIATAAIRAAVETGLPVWAGFSTEIGPSGAVQLLWDRPGRTFEQALRELDLTGVHVATVMHTQVEDITPSLEALERVWDGPFGAYPHAGHFEPPHWIDGDSYAPDELVALAAAWRAMGAQVFGTCCGLGADYVRALAGALT